MIARAAALTFLVLAGSVALAAERSAVEERIERVTTGLLPNGTIPGRFNPPAKLADRMAYWSTPGVSIAVLDGGRIDWARGFGVREAGRPDPVTERTLFQAASISKPVFALAVMRLVSEGKLDLDADVNGYLKSWQLPPTEEYQPRVTLRQILSHQAGLTVHGFPGYAAGTTVPTLVEVLEGQPPANTPPVRVNIVPGVQRRYSGGGFTLAQLAVTDRIGVPFAQLMRQLVLEPLEMRDSTYEQPLPKEREAEAASAHVVDARPIEGRWHVYPEQAAAGLWTTPADLARVGLELQTALAGGTSRVLDRERARQMLSPQGGDDMGIGFALEGGGARFAHSGSNEGFLARAVFYKEGGRGAVVMINSSRGGPLLEEVLRAVAREYGWPGYVEDPPRAATVEAAKLERWIGEYAAGSGFRATVTRQEPGLALTVAGQPALALLPSGEDGSLFATALDVRVKFADTPDGATLTLTQGGRPTTAKRADRKPVAGQPIPPGQDDAKAALESSPRHGEWFDVPGPDGKPLRTWVVFPERKDKAPVVLVIHEIFGLTDWIRGVADRLAADGFIAVAPDLLSGMGPGGGGTESFASRDDAVKAIRGLTPEEALKRVDAVRAHALALPAANGKSASIGFCWGGGRSFEYAATQPGLDAAVVFYGTSPTDPAMLARIDAPVLGLYGGDDARVNSTIAAAEAELKRLGKTYEVGIFEGAGHGFLRDQAGRDGANRKAAEAAWPRAIEFLRARLGR